MLRKQTNNAVPGLTTRRLKFIHSLELTNQNTNYILRMLSATRLRNFLLRIVRQSKPTTSNDIISQLKNPKSEQQINTKNPT